MRTTGTKVFIVAAVAGALMAGNVLAQGAPTAAPCSTPGVVKASVSGQIAETFVVPFAAHSSYLTPVAERVLEIAATSYPEQPILYIRIQGGEPANETETLTKIDRLTWVSAYLTQRDVPADAVVFEEPSMAQQMGCASPGQLQL